MNQPSFPEIFHRDPEASASAPGRVNLLGEHTDYNEGYVLPTAIGRQTHVQLARSPDIHCHAYSTDLAERIRFSLDDPTPEGFGSYLYGCLKALQRQGFDIPPVMLHIHSDIPMGVGLSSSAALEVAVLRGMRDLLGLELDDVTIAILGQQAEVEYAQVNCGIMDQMASSLADTRHMLFLDTRTLERRLLPLPKGTEILVLDSGLARTLAGSAYNSRRQECEEAARRLGVQALRDITDEAAAWTLPDPLNRRAHHVISEDNRVLEAVSGIGAHEFGALMSASHVSLRDNYEVSTRELDHLIDLLREHPSVHGAKLTGAGFGGACVALVKAGTSADVAVRVLMEYNQPGRMGRVVL